MKNIVLIGMPGCGKSTVGRELGKKLNRKFYDADEVVVEREGKTIPELFASSEDCFREVETRTLEQLAALENAVIATGGGAVTRSVNMELLRKNGTIFYINRPLEAIIADVDTTTRPLLAEGRERLYRLFAEREGLYRKYADYTIDGSDFGGIAPAILAIVKEVER